jgi:hypothetical protein
MKIPFREIANRITGFELPFVGGGISWEPPISDVEVARRLMTYLEDRRALYKPYDCETASYVVQSILDIRKRLTEELEQLDRASRLAQSLIAMRAACREFLDRVEGIDPDIMFYRPGPIWDRDERDFFMALGELRRTMGIHTAQIAVRYGIDVEETLVSIFPSPPSED